jgi:cysteine desulfurase
VRGLSRLGFDSRNISPGAELNPPGRIYLDYHATTPVDPRVAAAVLHYLTKEFGNASSADHVFGDEAERAVTWARAEVARLVDVSPEEIIFTSGATESVNLGFQGFVSRFTRETRRTPRVVISAVEHRAVLETARALAKAGRITLIVLPVDREAQVDLDILRRVAKSGVDLVCIMSANNEVGTLYPVDDIGAIVGAAGASFLCDATQAIGKVPLSATRSQMTFVAFSAHKIYGPMGVGALVVRRGTKIDPLWFGGGHERAVRPGTINVPGVVAFGEACRLRCLEMSEDEPAIAALRDTLQRDLLDGIDGLVVSQHARRLAGNLHISIPDVPNGAIIARVRHKLAIATGAACTSGIESASHVLQAMGLSQQIQDGALRLGLGKFTTASEIREVADILETAATETRRTLRS